jgi:hypothetical protein
MNFGFVISRKIKAKIFNAYHSFKIIRIMYSKNEIKIILYTD